MTIKNQIYISASKTNEQTPIPTDDNTQKTSGNTDSKANQNISVDQNKQTENTANLQTLIATDVVNTNLNSTSNNAELHNGLNTNVNNLNSDNF